MSEKLQQAIASIKSGNKQEGQQLLAQILQTEPNNETAWLWMSAVVDEDKRKYCIERVLKINPNNELALQALGKFSFKETKKAESTPSSATTVSKSGSRNEDQTQEVNFQEAESEQSDSITRTAIKDGFKTGAIFGVVGLPVILVLIILDIYGSLQINTTWYSISFFLFMCTSGIYTGLIFFRRQIGANFAVSAAGGISGIISGVIWGMTIGIYISATSVNEIPFSMILLICGFTFPVFIGIINSVTVWIPRIFINPNNPKKKRAIRQAFLEEYWDNKESKAFKKTPSPIVLQEFGNDSNSKEKFWIGSENCLFFLENEFLFGVIPQNSRSRFEESISKGSADFSLLNNKNYFLYTSINEATKQKSLITIEWIDKGESKYLEIDFNNENEANAIFDEIYKHVSNKLEKPVIPLETINIAKTYGGILGGILIFSTIAYYVMGYTSLIWIRSIAGGFADEVENFMKFFVTGGGVFIIGGIPFIATLGFMVYRLLQPPIIKLKIKQSISEKLQNAIHYIKSGDIQQGHSLLTQIVKAEPDNEEAWFWIASVSSENKKQIYLEKVLQIDPKHQNAKELLEKSRKIEDNEKKLKSIEPTPISEYPIKASPNALIGAALTDGLIVGLIGSILSAPLPIISMITNREIFSTLGMYLDSVILLSTGIATGILFYKRKIDRSGIAVTFGGMLAGLIAGISSGLILGYGQSDIFADMVRTSNSTTADANVVLYITICGLLPSLGGAVLGLSTAWIPGMFIKSEEIETSETTQSQQNIENQKQIDNLDSVGARFMNRLKRRFIVAGISIAIIFICVMCQSLAN